VLGEAAAPVESARVLSESTPLKTALVEQIIDLVVALKEWVDGLLGGATGQDTPEQVVSSFVAKLKELVDGLLGGAAGQDAPEQVVNNLVAKLKELVDGLLGRLLGGGEAPNPANMPTTPAALENLAIALTRLVEELQHSFFGQASSSFFEKVSNSPGQIYSALVDMPPTTFSFFSAEGIPIPTETPTGGIPMPVQAPVPAPTPPVSSFLGGSGSLGSGDAPVLLLGVLASFAILMLRGRFSWPSHALLKPLSGPRLTFERPG
jgi:hypothetical protein